MNADRFSSPAPADRLPRVTHVARKQGRRLLAMLLLTVPWTTFAVEVSGLITANTLWSNTSPIVVTGDVAVVSGVRLRVGPGTQVQFQAGTSLRAGKGARIEVLGTAADPVRFSSVSPNLLWQELAADGVGASLQIQHADIQGGAVKFRSGATGLMEDTYVHHFVAGTTPIAGCTSAAGVTIRRCHFNTYYETLWQFTPMLIEDSLFENANSDNSDALDFDGAPVGSTIRRCTFRHGPRSNTDAIDIGSGSQGVLIEDCVLWDFPNDKGVSIGENSFGIVVRNCLMVGCDSGVAVKDNCSASIEHCTIVGCKTGLRLYNKANPSATNGGGHITNAVANLVWGNAVSVSLLNGSTLEARDNDFSGLQWPGIGNFSADPLFLRAAEFDFRLDPLSPARARAADGTDVGVHFPVGRPLPPPALTVARADDGPSLGLVDLTPGEFYVVEFQERLGSQAWTLLQQFATPTNVPGVTLRGTHATAYYRIRQRIP